MQMLIFMIVLVFLALLGLVNLIVGIGRWLSDAGKLSGCTLVVEPPEDAERAESLLLHAAELLEYDADLRSMQMVVICPAQLPAREIAERFCKDRNIPLFCGWEQVNCG